MNVGPYMKVYDECICVYNRRGYVEMVKIGQFPSSAIATLHPDVW